MNRPSIPLRITISLCALAAFLYIGLRLAANPSHAFTPSEPIIGAQPNGTFLVPTGQTLTPAGKNITFDSRPLDAALSPDGATLALLLPGEIRLFDTAKGEFRTDTIKGAHTFGGIAWSHDGKTLYATGKVREPAENGGDNNTGIVYVLRAQGDGTFTEQKPLRFGFESHITPNKAAANALPTGLAIAPDDKTLYVSLFNNGTVAVVDLTSYDSATGAAKTTEIPVGSSPERIAVSPKGDKIYVANRGGRAPESGDTLDNEDPVVVDPKTYKVATGTITVLSASDRKIVGNIGVGLQPADLCFSPIGDYLYVANANSDSVSVIRTSADTVVDTIPTSPAPKRLAASSPNGLAVSPDGANLYITLGGDNAVSVIALDKASGGRARRTESTGLIPTAWFPLGVVVSRDGKNLFVLNSKGIGSLGEIATRKRPRNGGAATAEAGPGGVVVGDYKGHSVYNVLGSLEMIGVPNTAALRRDTNQVAQNNHFDRMAATLQAKPDPFWSRFKHVILIIKENRTYDQVFGDIPLGAGHIGGDPQLVMFGKKVTPNHHALAQEFGLFDNLYCSGAISADGHHWLNEAFADDYDERAMNNYPRSYPCCGTDPLSFAGNQFLWQSAMAAGKSFYNYGEFGPLPSIKPHSDNDYDQRVPPTADSNRDVAHAARILSDIQSGKPLAQLTMAWFGNDHTSGTTPGAFTPEACVADNDLAVGKLVEAITSSKKYWHDEPTAIFVVEDDAQGGLDHVEGHRTVGLVISPFNKRGQIVSTNYNQLNMLATIERMLNLKPLNQFDAAAVTMRPIFQEQGDFRPYTLRPHEIALNERNPSLAHLNGSAKHWARVSSTLDFSKPDRADPEQVTEILWHHTHGDAAYPPSAAAIR